MRSFPRVWLAAFLSWAALVDGLAEDQPASPGYRTWELPVPAAGKAGFTRLTAEETGISFTNVLRQTRSLTNQIYLNGSGLALGDVDNDGRTDLYLCGLDSPNALYRNLGGFRFEDVTERASVACRDIAATGAVFADIDGDGDLDLLVGAIAGGVRLFLNDGSGAFTEATAAAGLASKSGTTSLALADIDGDGLLDLYVVNYRSRTLRDEPDTRFKVSTLNGQFKLLSVDNQPVTSPDLVGRFSIDPVTGILENGETDVLYRNKGGGRFEPVPWTNGAFLDPEGKPVEMPYDWGLSAMFHDLNGDGAPDLYVCNDFHSEDRAWLNDGHGRFKAIPRTALRHTSLFSMGVDFADVDGDGHDEILVADMLSRSHARRQVQVSDRMIPAANPGALFDRPQYPRNMLFWNRGDGTYSEVAQLSGVEAADWCWCPVFMDVDLDGYPDLLMVTGHERDAQNIDLSRQIEATIRQRPMSRVAQLHLRKIFPPYDTPNFAFRNRGDLTFAETGQAWGFNSTQISQGIALADLDNDGDLDVVINCLNAAPLVYRNDSPSPRIAVRLRGTPPNRQGIGARLRVTGLGLPAQSREITCGGRYLSADDPVAVFAALSLTNRLRLDVIWRDGRRSLVQDVTPNQLVEVFQSDAIQAAGSAPFRSSDSGPKVGQGSWFEDASSVLQHQHAEAPWDDFQKQPLLPRRLSQGGPGITWFDLDGDGWEDLMIGSGRGGQLAAFQNRAGSLVRLKEPLFATAANRDQTTILGDSSQQDPLLFVGSANDEDGSTNGPAVRVLDWRSKTARDDWPGHLWSTGPLALGATDRGVVLFVGGQVIPARYPEPASSELFRPTPGGWVLDRAASGALHALGLVNSVIWSDLTGDGLPELIAACEWSCLRVFKLTGQGLAEITRDLGLDSYTGWWQSVNAGDFDGDGRLDLIAGNWGRNSKYQPFVADGLRIYSGDLNQDGADEILEAYYDPALKKEVPWANWESLARTMPFLRERYHSFTEFSSASVEELLGPKRSQMALRRVATLDSMLFLNRNGHFEGRPLPLDAQLSPVFGLVVADFDNDGREDAFLNQNFFAVPAGVSRYDAGQGVLLRGDGHGSFTATPGSQTGIRVDGEGRGAAVCDYDHDGRPDLALGQNAGATLLYHNQIGSPGIRVALRGPVGNPAGIGAVLRLEYANGRLGPAREIHAGSGYWSQDSAVQVLGPVEGIAAVQVRWPGGVPQRVAISSATNAVTVTFSARPGDRGDK